SSLQRSLPMKPDKLNRPDGSGPDPCCFNRRGFWVKGIVACKLEMPIQLSSVKGPCKKAVLLGGWGGYNTWDLNK
ncbi:MAG: hypothetical protein ACUVQ3_10225, partial [bacterium]